jgi:predicted PhzF superfamily epimerase YddE/YHI9
LNCKFVRRVFNGNRCHGNTAYVYFCEQATEFEDSTHLQNIANVRGYSATAFVLPKNKKLGVYLIRWFSPLTEIQFCGHATFAAADVVLSASTDSVDKLLLLSKKHEIQIIKSGNCNFVMRLTKVNLIATKSLGSLGNIFDRELINFKQNDAKDGYLVAQLPNKKCLTEFDFDADEYCRLTQRALIVTTQDPVNVNTIYFRYFAPQYGTKEDIATGSAAPILAEFWQLPFCQVYDCYQLSIQRSFYQISQCKEHVCVFATVNDTS